MLQYDHQNKQRVKEVFEEQLIYIGKFFNRILQFHHKHKADLLFLKYT